MAGRRNITVPSCWELIEKDYDGVAFYRRRLAVGQACRDRRCLREGRFIEPKISDSTATFHLQLAHVGERNIPAWVEIAIRSAGQPNRVAATISKTLHLKPGLNRRRWKLTIPAATH
jgi:hypothetical protein